MADDDLEARIEAGPGGGQQQVGGQQGAQKYIGVPDTYSVSANQTGRFGPLKTGYVLAKTPVPPRYVTGAEYRPRFLAPERIAALQQTLARSGLIGPKQTYRIGVWDETSASAYRKVLAYANQGGIDEDTALTEIAFNAQSGRGQLVQGDGSLVGAGGDVGRAGRTQTLTPAVTLEQQVQQSARARLGRKLRASEVKRFVSVYQGLERGVNAQELAAGDMNAAGQNAVLTPPPSPDVAASQFLDNGFATEEAGQNTLGYLDALKQLVGNR